MIADPSPAGSNGRDGKGRFTPGNRIGKGNPLAARIQKLRFAVVEAVTPAAVRRIILRLVKLAEDGDVAAAKVVLDRCLGAPVAADLLDRIEALESQLCPEVCAGLQLPIVED